jgi:hypothetical protein
MISKIDSKALPDLLSTPEPRFLLETLSVAMSHCLNREKNAAGASHGRSEELLYDGRGA